MEYLEICKQADDLKGQISVLESEVIKIVESLLDDFLFVQGEKLDQSFEILWYDEAGIQIELEYESGFLIPLQFIVDPIFRGDMVENKKKQQEDKKAFAQEREALKEAKEYELFLRLKEKYEGKDERELF